MAALSRYGIAELAQRRLSGSRPDATTVPEIEEMYPVIEQLANVQIKSLHYNETLPQGEVVPDATVLVTYVLPVQAYKSNCSMVELPTLPVRLPRLQGFRQVTPVHYENGDIAGDELDQLIPLPGDVFYSAGKSPVLSKVMGQAGYKHENMNLIFTENLLDNGIEQVEVKMLALGIGTYDDYSPLPLTAEMQGAIVEQLVEMYGGKTVPANPNTDIVNP